MAQGLAREEKTPNFWCVFFSNHLILIFMVDVLCLIFCFGFGPPFFDAFFPIFSSFPCCFCFIGVLSCLLCSTRCCCHDDDVDVDDDEDDEDEDDDIQPCADH